MPRFLWLVILLAGCRDDGAEASRPQHGAPPRPLAGVYPEDWRCDSIAPLDVLGAVLGGTVKQLESALVVPHGLPHPCNYEVEGKEPDLWSFDIDCRDGMKQRAEALFAQYAATSRDLVQHYEALAGSGGKAHDAAPELRPPEPARPVAVGAKALDHHGRGLIFIDDDAPCYVRVVGKDAGHRLALAKLLADRLTFANAPMTPRAIP